ncbi:SulP family inorganic anion transporter [Actinotalea sp. M2MS4P-6]|uniref:SulP family inorganic anion transporter n=1 Tax=Actinotalea sp. M2MS4P-6 TaxID=2983762 RepID=UPI0021E4A62F|nr:SulP family inorganic anion transporter [Actinotalea sp. M2MS4P-6]MCV2394767.1 SulP family inorganic anion transporter [Actinotalea sp. M2MS4P-6]
MRPGIDAARRAVGDVHLRKDVPAGLVLGVESVPDGLAAGLLAGVNPVFGLYGYLFGTLFGALATSSAFMAVQATGAMAVVLSDVEQVQGDSPQAVTALFTLSFLTGVVMLALGLARLGGVVRWVPNAVVTGFINAVAVNIVLGQLENLTGYGSDASNRVTRALDTVLSAGQLHWPSVLLGAVTIALIVALERTRLGALGMVVAIVVASVLVEVLGMDQVAQLREIAEVPRGLPSPQLPDLGLVGVLLVPAVSLAFVGLLQGAAISSSLPNPDGEYPDASGDFRGQGVANLACGLFQGMPVGGSMSATSIVTAAGARSRVALLVAAATMAAAVVAFSGLVGYIAMPALAGLLVVVGVRTFKPDNVRMVLRTGPVQATVMVTTFVLTLVIPLQYAVLAGVGLSLVLHVVRQSNRIRVRQWRFDPDGTVTELDPPRELAPGSVVVLRPYGSLFFAAVASFEAALPAVTEQSRNAVVILTMRGKEDLGSTFINVVRRYAARLHAVGSTLMLAGVSDQVAAQLESTGTADELGRENLFRATDAVTASTRQALEAAAGWTRREPEGPGDDVST